MHFFFFESLALFFLTAWSPAGIRSCWRWNQSLASTTCLCSPTTNRYWENAEKDSEGALLYENFSAIVADPLAVDPVTALLLTSHNLRITHTSRVYQSHSTALPVYSLASVYPNPTRSGAGVGDFDDSSDAGQGQWRRVRACARDAIHVVRDLTYIHYICIIHMHIVVCTYIYFPEKSGSDILGRSL